jgi:hypothetical protein
VLAVHTNFQLIVGTVIMTMLSGLLANYCTTVEHIELGGATNILTN